MKRWTCVGLAVVLAGCKGAVVSEPGMDRDGAIAGDSGGRADGAPPPPTDGAPPIDDDGGTTPPADGSIVVGPIPLAELTDAIEIASCAMLVRCHALPDRATCMATVGPESLWRGLAQAIAAASAGALTYDAAQARACLDWIGARECVRLTAGEFALACTGVFTGSLPDGADCVSSEQCASGLCAGGSSDCTTLGTCRALPARLALHAACSDSSRCPEGTFCSTGGLGFGGTCEEKLAVGSECVGDEWEVACAGGAYCSTNFSISIGTCIVPGDEGGACIPAAPIPCRRFDDYCNAATERCERRLPEGSACEWNQCIPYTMCSDGHCTRLSSEGGACDVFAGSWCLGTLECSVDSICEQPAAPVVCPTA